MTHSDYWFRTALVATLLTGCDRQASARQAASVKHEVAVKSAAEPTSVKTTNTVKADPHSIIVAEMQRILVSQGTMDGASIASIQNQTSCRSAFTTGKGTVVIDWSQIGNVAPRRNGRLETNLLPTAGVQHILSIPFVPSPDAADGISGAIGLLASDCGATNQH